MRPHSAGETKQYPACTVLTGKTRPMSPENGSRRTSIQCIKVNYGGPQGKEGTRDGAAEQGDTIKAVTGTILHATQKTVAGARGGLSTFPRKPLKVFIFQEVCQDTTLIWVGPFGHREERTRRRLKLYCLADRVQPHQLSRQMQRR